MTTDNLQEISAQIVHEDTASFDARQILEQMKQEAAKEAAIAAEENRIPGARTGVLTPLNTNRRNTTIFSRRNMTARSVW